MSSTNQRDPTDQPVRPWLRAVVQAIAANCTLAFLLLTSFLRLSGQCVTAQWQLPTYLSGLGVMVFGTPEYLEFWGMHVSNQATVRTAISTQSFSELVLQGSQTEQSFDPAFAQKPPPVTMSVRRSPQMSQFTVRVSLWLATTLFCAAGLALILFDRWRHSRGKPRLL